MSVFLFLDIFAQINGKTIGELYNVEPDRTTNTSFERIQNELYRLLYGREEIPARWKFCIAYVNGNLGMSVGSLFVRKYFDGQSKQDVRR